MACEVRAAERTEGWAPERRVRRVWPCVLQKVNGGLGEGRGAYAEEDKVGDCVDFKRL